MKTTMGIAPTIFTVFGATGDLVGYKIIPALFHLWTKKNLPEKFRIVGVARKDLGNEVFKENVRGYLKKFESASSKESIDEFAELCSYSQGQFDDPAAFEKLKGALSAIDAEWGMCTNKLFYFSTPPNFYETIARNLAASGLTEPCGGDQGWTRVIVEKPFGKDLETAEKLDELLGELFQESQIYRIDHYLAKEMLQNLMAFRFSNNLFEKAWNRESIESVAIRCWEKVGVEDRGAFFDSVGALRDVGQNHLLQILALISMEQPMDYGADSVRARRTEVLETIKVPTQEEVERDTFRAQYEGYRSIPGVAADSETETYFKVRAFLTDARWRGVPFTFEWGKRMGEATKDIVVTFKHPSPCMCPSTEIEHFQNRVIFKLEPEEGIKIEFWSKKPGLEMLMEERDFNFTYRAAAERGQNTGEYEKLLFDCIAGDQSLFVSTEEISALWKFIDPIVTAWKAGRVPLKTYTPDSSDVSREAVLGDSLTYNSDRVLGMVGLGKMGKGLTLQLAEKGWKIHALDANPEAAKALASNSVVAHQNLEQLVNAIPTPRRVWLMVPAGKPVDETLEKLLPLLSKGDTLIDGGNSFFKDTVRRGKMCAEQGIHFLDVGTSGGPSGARNGACLMIGGEHEAFESLHSLFEDLALPGGYGYMGKVGAGHFVKMVHNGIEYGMMQAIAEGFAVMKESDLALDLSEITRLYNHGSVIESRLVGWLKSGYEAYGEELSSITGSVAQSGEGLWTVETAKEFGIPVPIIEGALQFRFDSQKNPSYTGKILSALRNQFGGHSAK